MSELTVVIADDEPLAISNLKAKLATYPQLNIVACFDNGDDTLQFLQQHQVDLVFLDIQMPGHKGIDILQLFPCWCWSPLMNIMPCRPLSIWLLIIY